MCYVSKGGISRLKVKVARLHDSSDRCWPKSRERNVLESKDTKIGGKGNNAY